MALQSPCASGRLLLVPTPAISALDAERLRTRLRTAVGTCPCCKRPRGLTKPLAAEVGVNHSTLWRFLKGSTPTPPLVEKLEKWLGRQERRA